MAQVTVILVMLIVIFFQHHTLFSTSLASGQPDVVGK